ncbi:MAG: pilus assembly protein [Chloroflexi bacterium]|nr:pilus assembly protein [Chloroflexota bacterium]
MRVLLKRIVEILDGTPAAQPPDRRKGQSLVEMVFITPILLIMFIGLIEIGWFAQNYLNLVEAAKVGARRGPFLAGEFSPQEWPNASSLPPTAAFGFTLNPGDAGYDDDPRIIYRGMVGGTQTCDNILPGEFGFFNTIACAVVDSMDPLRLRLGNSKDDVVISAFSVQYVKVGSNPSDDIDPDDHGSTTPYANGNQVVVVGRWPSNANECVEWGERDPFDWIENGSVDWEYWTDPFGGPDLRINYEIAVWNDTISDYVGWLDSGTERAVGWSWTGQRQIEDVNRARIDCWGSQFTLDRVQDLLNLPTFIPPGSTDEQERKSYFPSLGLVIVEVYWEHSLLLENFPLLSAQWSPVYQVMGGDDPTSTADVIYAWAAFPVPSAEPRLAFKP